jgi:hypothetical protein
MGGEVIKRPRRGGQRCRAWTKNKSAAAAAAPAAAAAAAAAAATTTTRFRALAFGLFYRFILSHRTCRELLAVELKHWLRKRFSHHWLASSYERYTDASALVVYLVFGGWWHQFFEPHHVEKSSLRVQLHFFKLQPTDSTYEHVWMGPDHTRWFFNFPFGKVLVTEMQHMNW